MALVKENGSGILSANSYATAADVTAYLTDRGRETENTWSTRASGVQEAACIAATDYIENRFRDAFRGVKEFRTVTTAKSTLEFTAQPSAGEVVVVGSQTYTFQAALSGAGDVLIGDSTSDTLDNLVGAITADASLSGSGFHSATTANADATAVAFYDDAILVYARSSGTAGNGIATTTDVTGASWNFAATTGGSDRTRPQPLSFPRAGLTDRDGLLVLGIPDGVLAAVAEYAVRSLSSTLAPDPKLDARGGIVSGVREKIGPLETATTYLGGTANSGRFPAYPAADALLRAYTVASGGVIRG